MIVHQERDTINPCTHPFVMVKTSETAGGVHPLWEHFMPVFYTSAELAARSPHHDEFLWVGCIDPGHRPGFLHARLPKMGSIPQLNDPDAFGSPGPSCVPSHSGIR